MNRHKIGCDGIECGGCREQEIKIGNFEHGFIPHPDSNEGKTAREISDECLRNEEGRIPFLVSPTLVRINIEQAILSERSKQADLRAEIIEHTSTIARVLEREESLRSKVEKAIDGLKQYAHHNSYCASLRAKIRKCDCDSHVAVETLTYLEGKE